MDLPATFMVSIAQEIGDRIELLGDVTWTGWSTFEELRVVYDNPVQPDTLSLQEWEDVFRYSAGISFALNERLVLRGGVAFDEEAIPSPQRRTPRIPGNDRTWISFGAGYDFNANLTLDVGYAHLFLDGHADRQRRRRVPGEARRSAASTTPASTSSSAQLSWHFD